MTTSWPNLLPHWLVREPLVLVTVAATEGSAPREAGVSMLVGADETAETIGGGHLEWEAMALARQMLQQADGPSSSLVRFALGPSLGQCCGGVVWLLFERLEQADARVWHERVVQLARGLQLQRRCSGGEASSWQAVPAAQRARSSLQRGLDGWVFDHSFGEALIPVVLFGAGHVGAAIAQALAPLPVRLSWIDNRDSLFEHTPHPSLQLTDMPEAEVDAALPGSYFLVLTHSHALDLALCERIFRRNDYAYFGLIGSRSKRRSFEHRLLARGVALERLAEMTCPIGLSGLRDKTPAVIAVSVVAQILQVREARSVLHRAAGAGTLPTLSAE